MGKSQMTSVSQDSQICEVPRWSMIKATLSNLNFDAFIEAFHNSNDAVLVDCRRPDEYDEYHLDKAININYLDHELADKIEQLNSNKTYYVYCRSGRRSLRMCKLMENSGIQKVFNMEDGIVEHL